jgi:hypothetical protein
MMRFAEELDQRELIERAVGCRCPPAALEHHVAVEPSDGPARCRQRREREVEQALLLPQHVAAPHLNHDLGVIAAEVKLGGVGQLHRQQRHHQVPPEDVVVREPAAISDRIEVASDGPEVVHAPPLTFRPARFALPRDS